MYCTSHPNDKHAEPDISRMIVTQVSISVHHEHQLLQIIQQGDIRMMMPQGYLIAVQV